MNHLRDWLDDIRQRGCTITVTDRVVQVRGVAATDTDRHQVNRHRHALELAAAGTHPTWWHHVLGRTDLLDLDGMPHSGDGFACACCGNPADQVDPSGLPWCQDHR